MSAVRRNIFIGLLVTASILLSGCAIVATPGTGMMGAGSNYYFSNINCKVPSNLHGAPVKVFLSDMGMTRMMGGVAPRSAHMRLVVQPQRISAGVVSFIAENLGWRTHELVILPLAVGQQAGSRVIGSDGKTSEYGSVGEASNNCGLGVGEGIAAGSASWMTISLKPGRYELVCNLANHYADGMYQELDVI